MFEKFKIIEACDGCPNSLQAVSDLNLKFRQLCEKVSNDRSERGIYVYINNI